MILKIALKNLSEHKVKSYIIGGLIALGMFLLIVTLSIGETSNVGIEKSFVQSFSGHVLIGIPGKDGSPPQILPGAGFGNSDGPKSIQNFDKLWVELGKFDFIDSMSPQVFTVFSETVGETWQNFQGFGLGFNTQAYKKMFPDNLNITTGNFPEENSPGAMVPQILIDRFKKAVVRDKLPEIRKTLSEELKPKSDDDIVDMVIKKELKVSEEISAAINIVDLKVGDSIKLQGYTGNLPTKSVKVTGIYSYKNDNAMLESALILDLSTIRYLSGLVVGSAKQSLGDEAEVQKILKENASEDSFFASSEVLGETKTEGVKTQEDYEKIFQDNAETKNLNRPDEGAFNYVLVRLKDGTKLTQNLETLNAMLKDKFPKVTAVDWKTAGGILAATATIIQAILMAIIGLIVVVSVIIIINTMVASIIERTGEIGTMRALGAQKGFVRSVIGVESMLIAVVGSLVGMFLALLLIIITSSTGFHTDNEILKTAFGAKQIYPILTFPSIAIAFIVIVLLGYISSAYPTMLATRISPLKAMQS